MKFSILHISDLHRDLTDELGNAALVESLIKDADRYSSNDPVVQKPSICIVSGDLVYGANLGSPDYSNELSRQYQQAQELLIAIADRLFDGDRQRIVIIPGNHDISYNDVISACKQIPIPTKDQSRAQLVNELFKTGTRLRWSWSKMCFYRIIDESKYAARLTHFSQAYDEFYQGIRTFSLDPTQQFAVFDYPELNFTILGLNSCHDNDPLHRAGAINPDALVAAINCLKGTQFTGRLVAATWHHSLFGGPNQDDYINSDMLLHLIDGGVSIGFHGHQHRSLCVEERHRISSDDRKIVVVSAGTLCAGPGQLNPGEPRGYNIVEVDTEAYTCRVHQRTMFNQDFTFPIWAPGHFIETNSAHIDIEITPPLVARTSRLDESLRLEDAIKFIALQQWQAAVNVLSGSEPGSIGRSLLVNALQNLNDPVQTFNLLWPPTSNSETVLVGDAILQGKMQTRAREYISLDIVDKSTDASIKEIIRRVRGKYL